MTSDDLIVEKLERLREVMEQRFELYQEALKLQAAEYERRLDDLNHAHEKAVEVQHTYITRDKFEAIQEAEKEARDAALLRIDEKFDDYIRRYEARQAEVDQNLAIQKASAETALRIAEDQGRKANRNIGIATIVITIVIGLANYLGALG